MTKCSVRQCYQQGDKKCNMERHREEENRPVGSFSQSTVKKRADLVRLRFHAFTVMDAHIPQSRSTNLRLVLKPAFRELCWWFILFLILCISCNCAHSCSVQWEIILLLFIFQVRSFSVAICSWLLVFPDLCVFTFVVMLLLFVDVWNFFGGYN